MINHQRMTESGSPAWWEKCQRRWSAQPAGAPLIIVKNRWPHNFKHSHSWNNLSVLKTLRECGCFVFNMSDGALQARLASIQPETKDVRNATSHSWGVREEDWSWWGSPPESYMSIGAFNGKAAMGCFKLIDFQLMIYRRHVEYLGLRVRFRGRRLG